MSMYSINNKLSLRLEDAEENVFTEPTKTNAVQIAERTIAYHLHKNYLTPLKTVASNKTATNGELEMSIANLGYEVLKGAQGIERVKLSGGKWCKPIDIMDTGKLQHPDLQGSPSNPMYWIYDNKIYVSAGVASPVIDVYFMRVPRECVAVFECGNVSPSATSIIISDVNGVISSENDTYNNAVIIDIAAGTHHVVTNYTGSTKTLEVTPTGTFSETTTFSFVTAPWGTLNLAGVDSDLESSFLDLILDFAESECWGMDNKASRGADAYNKGMAKIQSLNAVYEKAAGIGTGTRKEG